MKKTGITFEEADMLIGLTIPGFKKAVEPFMDAELEFFNNLDMDDPETRAVLAVRGIMGIGL